MSQFQQEHSSLQPDRGVLILVLGILGIVVCGFIAPFAWIMGKGDIAKMDAGVMNPEGRGLTQGGMICGIVGTILIALSFLIVFLLIIGSVLAAA